ncbi:aspartyl protease family protein [Aquimarina rubra]|uniref:Aspartyl protease family protein n=1 Tax=Aquimarina rubra TaxID=1920033 RepID=A0ABW5LCM1_9FLAO
MKSRIVLVLFLLYCGIIVAQKQFNDTIPFRNDLGLIMIPIKFNGVEKNFIFDTGATNSVGFSWVRNELAKTSKTLKITSSSRKKSRLRYYKSDSVNLASAKITKHRILMTGDSDIFSCYDIDGVLGVDIIAQFNWAINFDQQYLVMYPKDFLPDEAKEMYPIDFDYTNRRPGVFLKFGSEQIRFLLDTGATYSDIYTKDYDRIQSLDHTSREAYSGFFDFKGDLTKSKSTIMRFSPITSNDVTINGIFDLSKKSNKIGNGLWKNNTLFLSLESKKLYVKQKNIDEYRKDYGCAFVFENNRMKVIKVVVDSEAWKKGLRQGDDVKMINGQTFEDFCSLQQFQEETSGKEAEVTITLHNNTNIVLQKKTVL